MHDSLSVEVNRHAVKEKDREVDAEGRKLLCIGQLNHKIAILKNRSLTGAQNFYSRAHELRPEHSELAAIVSKIRTRPDSPENW
jgi:hypothetical protein